MINKLINHSLALLVQWLQANKISLNTSKTELVLFRPKGNAITKNLKWRKNKIIQNRKRGGVVLNEN